jgi:hypothetical protein
MLVNLFSDNIYFFFSFDLVVTRDAEPMSYLENICKTRCIPKSKKRNFLFKILLHKFQVEIQLLWNHYPYPLLHNTVQRNTWSDPLLWYLMVDVLRILNACQRRLMSPTLRWLLVRGSESKANPTSNCQLVIKEYQANLCCQQPHINWHGV